MRRAADALVLGVFVMTGATQAAAQRARVAGSEG